MRGGRANAYSVAQRRCKVLPCCCKQQICLAMFSATPVGAHHSVMGKMPQKRDVGHAYITEPGHKRSWWVDWHGNPSCGTQPAGGLLAQTFSAQTQHSISLGSCCCCCCCCVQGVGRACLARHSADMGRLIMYLRAAGARQERDCRELGRHRRQRCPGGCRQLPERCCCHRNL